MKKYCWILIAVLLLASVVAFGAWAPASAQEDEVRYVDAQVISTISSETIYFTSRDVNLNTTDGKAPFFASAGVGENSCGAVAGAEIVAFYDKYYPNLIPNWESYMPSNGKYKFQDDEHILPLMQELYDLMQINVQGHGVSEAEFKTGLTKYFNNHGYSLGYQNVKSGSGLNFNSCVSAIDNNKIIVLFTTVGDLYFYNVGSSQDTISTYSVTGNHIMIAYGYVEVKYYNDTGLFRTERMLLVATGWGGLSTAYYKINPSNLEAAYMLNVD